MYSIEIVLYNIYLTYLVQYLSTGGNAARLGVSTTQMTALTNMLTAWTVKYNLYIDPGTHSEITTGDINTLYDTDSAYTDALKQQIKNVLNLVLTTADYKYTQINKDAARRGSIPVPEQECEVGLRSSSHLKNIFTVSDVDNPTKRGKPVDVARIGVKILVRAVTTPAAPDPTLDDLLRVADSGSMKIIQNWLDTQVGFEGFISTCFLNEKGEEGDWSEITPFTII